MKKLLFLSLSCAAALFSGCRSNNYGGTRDTYTGYSGSAQQTEPTIVEPSIAPGADDIGPQLPPP